MNSPRSVRFSLVVFTLAVVACSAPGAVPSVDQGVTPRMEAAEVERIVVERFRSMQSWFEAAGRAVPDIEIQSMTVTTAGRIPDVEASGAVPDDPAAVVWIVRARGPFVGLRVPAGQQPAFGESGYFVISDALGEVLGMGMP
jgi:hypothetical protein